jgi:hypothetical protein
VKSGPLLYIAGIVRSRDRSERRDGRTAARAAASAARFASRAAFFSTSFCSSTVEVSNSACAAVVKYCSRRIYEDLQRARSEPYTPLDMVRMGG